ncbi:MAG: hypothetical protein ACK40G_01160 [Cytophagaceae bacterium]
MLQRLKQKVFQKDKAAGAEVLLLPEGSMEYNLCLLSIKKNIIVKEFSESKIGLDKFCQLVKEDVPVALSVSGKGILTRVIKSDSDDEKNLLSQVFPNAKIQEYYLQSVRLKDGKFVVTIARKDLIDNLLDQISKTGLKIISVNLGPFSVANVNQLLKFDPLQIVVSNHCLVFEDYEFSGYRISEEGSEAKTLVAGGEKLLQEEIVAYSNAFSLLFQTEIFSSIEVETVKYAADEFQQQKIFKVAGWSTLIFFMLILLINAVLFTSLNSKNQLLSAKLSQFQGIGKDTDKLEKELSEKESFLSEAGWLDPSRSSYYSDRIAASVPPSIRLTRLAVNPYDDKTSKAERKIIFQNGLIILTGNCSKTTELNTWIKTLKGLEWVKDVKVQDYTFDDKNKTGEFKIELQLV